MKIKGDSTQKGDGQVHPERSCPPWLRIRGGDACADLKARFRIITDIYWTVTVSCKKFGHGSEDRPPSQSAWCKSQLQDRIVGRDP